MRQTLIIIAIALLGWCAYVLFVLQTELNQPENILQLNPDGASEILIIPDVASFKAHISAHEGTVALWPGDSVFNLALQMSQVLDAHLAGSEDKTSLAICRYSSDFLITVLPGNTNKSGLNELTAVIQKSGLISNNQIIVNYDGLLCISANQSLLSASSDTRLTDNSGFAQAFKKSGKNSDAIYLYQTDSTEAWNNFDLVIHERHLLLNGFQKTNQKAGSHQADSLGYSMPVMSSADSLTFYKGNWRKIQNDADKFWQEKELEAQRNNMLNEAELTCNCSVQNAFEYWPKGNVMSYKVNGKKIVSLGSQGSSSALEALSNLADTSAALNIYGNRLLALKSPLNLSLILGDKGSTIAEFALVGKFFTAFSKDKEVLAALARELETNKVLNTPPGALNPAEFLLKNAEWTAEGLGNFALSQNALPDYEGIPIHWKSLASITSSATTQVLQDSLLFVNAVIGLNSNFVPQSAPANSGESVWETSLDAALAYGPMIITNHYTKEKELFVQDANNAIYLISSSGNILWKTSVDGPVISAIEQIDMFKNGKLQMVFGTSASVYCLDRNGRSLDGFPVRLKAKASSALKVFDYDRDKNYRLVVACEDGLIYNFNTEGKPTKGWQNKKGNIWSAIEHLRFGNNDYLITLSKNGEVALLKRDGTARTNYKNDLQIVAESAIIQVGTTLESSGWITSDTEGNVYALMFDGAKARLLSSNAAQQYLETLPAAGDSAPDFILWNGNSIKRMDINSKIIWEFPCNSRPRSYRSKGEFLISYSEAGLHYVKSPDGADLNGFPKTGNNSGYLGLLDKSGNIFSITAHQNKIICRKLDSGNPRPIGPAE